jgi:PAS domain S-box-containing protein
MGAPLRVLLVEDNEDDALLLVSRLEQNGYDVTWERVDTPSSMTSALERKEWDVVIADHGMPYFSAPASLELLKRKKLDLPFIIVSGAIGEDTAVAAMKAGAHDYLTKSDLTRLVPAIEREVRDAEARRERRNAEESREASHRFLEIANRHTQMSSLLEEFVEGIAERTGCDAAGIRLFDENGSGTHQVYRGFPKRFYELECLQASVFDSNCICATVLKGEGDPNLPMFTEASSFFVNGGEDCSSEDTDVAGAITDNLCSQFGYRSMAIAPIRTGDRILGLIHVADPGENMVPPHRVATLEDGALILGAAVLRLETLQALKESEDHYRTLVEYSLTGVYVRRGDRLLFVNDRAVEITGYEREELLNMSLFSLIHPEHREDAAEQMAHREADEKPTESIQYLIVTKTGEHRWIDALGIRINYQGQPAVLANCADITERKRAEEALVESEEKYRLHFENMRDVIYTTDRTFCVTGVSPSVEAVLGYKPEEIVGRRIDELELLQPEHYEQALRNTSRLLAGERITPSEYVFIAKDGTKKFGEIISSPMIKDGEIVATINVARDVTERKRAEQVIRDSEARYRALFENTPIQIVVVDSDGCVTAVNRARRGTGIQPPNVGDKMYIDYAPLHHNDMRAELMDCIAAGVSKEFPEQQYGRRILSIRMSPNPGGAMIISEDISDRKWAEDWLKQSHSLLSATLESTADGIMVVDMQGNMLSSNRRFVEMWRVPEQVMASHDDEQVRSFFLDQLKYPQEALREEKEIFADPEKERVDVLEFKDGRIFERYTRPQKIGGNNVGIVFSFRDVTERKRVERELGNSLSLLSATLESTADGILVVGTDGGIQGYNKRFLDIWRLSEGMMESLDPMEMRSICMSQLKNVELEVSRVAELYANPDRERVDLMEFIGGRIVERYSRPQKLGGKTVGLVFSFRDITERRLAEKKLLENREQLRQLTSQLSLAEERERRRIANQLHDRVGQALLASKLKLGTARESGLPPNIDEPLDDADALLEQTIQDVRSLTFELSPPILYMLGFEAAVEWLTERAEKQYGIDCTFEDDALPKPLEEDIKVLLFQNVRELLVNVGKHSRAQKANVSVSRAGNHIQVLVEDNGIGFDASRVNFHWDESSGFGLFSIRERLSHLGGEIMIDSEAGRGTRVCLKAPLRLGEENTDGEKT